MPPGCAATYLKLLLTAFFWGGTFIAGRYVSPHAGPFSAAFLRFAIGSAVLLAITYRSVGNLPRLTPRQLAYTCLLGLVGVFAYNFFFFSGLRSVEASRAAVIVATNPVSITIFSALIFRERVGARGGFGISISVVGAILVITRGDPALLLSGGLGAGELLIFGCVLSWTAYSLLGKSVMEQLPPLIVVTYSSILGTAMLAPAALAEGLLRRAPALGPVDWAGIAYLGVFGTALGFNWYYQGITRIGPSRASQFISFVPVSAVALAFLVLREPVTLSLLAGTALVVAGVYLANKGHVAA